MDTHFTFANLHQAYLDCRKRKYSKINHLRFAENLEFNLLKLEEELQNRTYKPGQSIAFVVQKPKIREIFAADFRDRVVHHLLYNYLGPYYERIFIFDSWACRKNKGTHKAVARTQQFAVRLQREREREREISAGFASHYLKMDIKSFFTSINQEILYELVKKKIKNEEILWLTRIIIFHDPAHDVPPKIQSQISLFALLPPEKSLFTVACGKGLPIGNLTSQFLANIYLNELDQFVKHTLRAKYYVRYVDDLVILDGSREKLEYYQNEIGRFVSEKLDLVAHPQKQFIRPISCGIDFVGYVIRPEYILIRRRVVGDWRRKLEILSSLDKKECFQVMASYLAHAKWANAYQLKKKIMGQFLAKSESKKVKVEPKILAKS
jgi:RNA-directed DNA polymerase